MENILQTMYNMHIKMTKQNPPAFTYEVPFDKTKFDVEKYNMIELNGKFNEFIIACYGKYRVNNPEHKIGSLDINPNIWAKIALKSITDAYKAGSTKVIFPNGCCTIESCPINKFYALILNEFTL